MKVYFIKINKIIIETKIDEENFEISTIYI